MFSGTEGLNAAEFIHEIRSKAIVANKQRDNDWLVDVASACFIGKALQWHTTLDPEIQDDWKKLQRALFEQYPLESHPSS